MGLGAIHHFAQPLHGIQPAAFVLAQDLYQQILDAGARQ